MSCFSNLINLEELQLNGNDWSGSYDLTVLPLSIISLYFGGTKLNPQPFPNLSNYSFTRNFNLRSSNVYGTINPAFIPKQLGPSAFFVMQGNDLRF